MNCRTDSPRSHGRALAPFVTTDWGDGISGKELIGASEVTSMAPPYSVPPAQRNGAGGVRASYNLTGESYLCVYDGTYFRYVFGPTRSWVENCTLRTRIWFDAAPGRATGRQGRPRRSRFSLAWAALSLESCIIKSHPVLAFFRHVRQHNDRSQKGELALFCVCPADNRPERARLGVMPGKYPL